MNFTTSPKAAVAPVFSQTTLSNGIKLSTKQCDSKVASFKFSASLGSGYETLSQKGAAQLLASSAFSSTSTASSIRLVRDLENIGAVFESSADREKLDLSVSCPAEVAESAFVIISNFFANGPNAHYLIDESKDVAQVAYDNHFSDPASVLSELIHEAAYGEGTPFGSSIYAPNLKGLSGKEVLNFRSANLNAGSTFIAASGVEAKSVQTWAETAFQSLATGTTKAPSTTFKGGDIKLKAETSGMAYSALAFPIPAGDAGKAYEVLEGSLAAKLAGSSVTPFIAKYASGGIFGFYSTCNTGETDAKLQSGVAAMKEIAGGKVSVDAAKNNLSLRKSIILEGEGSTSLLIDALRAGSPIDKISKYGDISQSAVSAAAAAALKVNPAYAVLGSTVGTPSYDVIAKMMK
jgi:predicted Zn-dependent peptidase